MSIRTGQVLLLATKWGVFLRSMVLRRTKISMTRSPWGGMLWTAGQHECALLTYTLGLKPFLDRIDIVAIDEREVPRDFHHVYMVYKKEEFQNRATESFIDFATKFPVPDDIVLRCGKEACDVLR